MNIVFVAARLGLEQLDGIDALLLLLLLANSKKC